MITDLPVKEISLLLKAVEQGIIDIDLIAGQVKMKRKEDYLKEHKFSIWQAANGYWYTYVIRDCERKQLKRKTKEALEDCIIRHYEENDPEKNPSFREEYQAWIDSKREFKEIKESSLRSYDDNYRRFFKGTGFEKLKVTDIDDLILDEFIRKNIADYHLTAKAYAGLRTIILGTMKYAKRYRHTDFSISTFFKDFQISKSAFAKPSNRRKIVYTRDERAKLFAYFMDNPTMEHLGLALMTLTGMRIGEIAALKKEDNTSNQHLFIHRTEVRERDKDGKNHFVVQDSAKMDHDEEIVIPKIAQRVIDLAYMQSHDDEYLFSVDGVRIRTKQFRYHLKKACDSVGIRYLPPHQMRKTCGSILLASGIDDAIVRREMRHTEIATTRAYYQYVIDSDDYEKRMIDKIMGL